jgi:hypothetical protein
MLLMFSGSGSKGTFVGNNSDRKKLRKLRHKHNRVSPLVSNEINPNSQLYKKSAGKETHNTLNRDIPQIK